MSKPKECPKCKSEEINNAYDMCDTFGISKDDEKIKEWMCTSCYYFFDNDEAELTSWHQGRDYSEMTLFQISDVIYEDWGREMPFKAHRYVEAIANLDNLDDVFGADSGNTIVAYFLENAKDWRGETARDIKKVLNKMLKDHIEKKK